MDIKVSKKACKLTFEFDSSDITYGFLMNITTGEFSNIEKVDGSASYEVGEDGIYKFFLIESEDFHFGLELRGAEVTDYQGFYIGTRYFTLEEYAENVESVENGVYVGLNLGNFYTKKTFCACKLEKCLLNLQMKTFRELLKNCGNGCKNLDEIKSQRDFLFIANWIMQHLEEYDRFEELLEVYKGIQSCKNLCSDLLANNKCKCNG